jgi:hypothetical protein
MKEVHKMIEELCLCSTSLPVANSSLLFNIVSVNIVLCALNFNQSNQGM